MFIKVINEAWEGFIPHPFPPFKFHSIILAITLDFHGLVPVIEDQDVIIEYELSMPLIQVDWCMRGTWPIACALESQFRDFLSNLCCSTRRELEASQGIASSEKGGSSWNCVG